MIEVFLIELTVIRLTHCVPLPAIRLMHCVLLSNQTKSLRSPTSNQANTLCSPTSNHTNTLRSPTSNQTNTLLELVLTLSALSDIVTPRHLILQEHHNSWTSYIAREKKSKYS